MPPLTLAPGISRIPTAGFAHGDPLQGPGIDAFHTFFHQQR